MILLKDPRKVRWLYVFGWVSLIYSTLYIVRPVCEFLKKSLPFALLMNALMVAVLMVVAVIIFRKIKGLSNYVLFLTILGVYAYKIAVIQYPEEKLHFIEYGILAYLVLRALSLDHGRMISYAGAAVLTAFFGWGDELIQHILPNRYYQFSDVLLNAESGVLALAMAYIFERSSATRKERI